MSTATVWLVIGVTAISGFVLRAAFILVPVLPRRLPARLKLVLDMVPAAAFAALVAPALFLDGHGDGSSQFALISPATIAGAATLLVAWKAKSLALSIVCGLAVYALVDLVL